MKKLSTVLGTMAAGALLATAGVGAASAAGPEADTVDSLRSAVAGGMEEMKSALNGSSAVAAATQTTTVESAGGTAGQSAPGSEGEVSRKASKKGALELTGSTHGADGGIRDQCVGSLLESEDLVNGYGTTIGRVELWYSSSAGPNGQNCVMTHNYLDGRNYTDATLLIDDDDNGEYAERWSEDMDEFYNYAGGSYLNDVNGKCVWFFGQVDGNDPNSVEDDAWYRSGWVRCG
ncbi:hypothetical protein [Ornithinimicrobium faecis]|uniref:hypothetical protein n=1 Tax=Ornithinimicrobium faecis TaxID=2934158 RepID=UPI0021189297|nr:hypothetical protein [Ornithinimicrobium sp. HY1745]